MKRRILLFLSVCLICLCFTACENKHDMVEVRNESGWVFDDINIEIKKGYFYEKHEKFTVDEKTIGVTIYFSIEEDGGWGEPND